MVPWLLNVPVQVIWKSELWHNQSGQCNPEKVCMYSFSKNNLVAKLCLKGLQRAAWWSLLLSCTHQKLNIYFFFKKLQKLFQNCCGNSCYWWVGWGKIVEILNSVDSNLSRPSHSVIIQSMCPWIEVTHSSPYGFSSFVGPSSSQQSMRLLKLSSQHHFSTLRRFSVKSCTCPSSLPTSFLTGSFIQV